MWSSAEPSDCRDLVLTVLRNRRDCLFQEDTDNRPRLRPLVFSGLLSAIEGIFVEGVCAADNAGVAGGLEFGD